MSTSKVNFFRFFLLRSIFIFLLRGATELCSLPKESMDGDFSMALGCGFDLDLTVLFIGLNLSFYVVLSYGAYISTVFY